MRLVHNALVYFGLREPTPEDESLSARLEPAPWWRVLLAAAIAIAVFAALMWVLGAPVDEALVRAAIIGVAVTVVSVARERLARRSKVD